MNPIIAIVTIKAIKKETETNDSNQTFCKIDASLYEIKTATPQSDYSNDASRFGLHPNFPTGIPLNNKSGNYKIFSDSDVNR